MAAISDVDATSLLARISGLFLFDEEAGNFVFRVRRGKCRAGSVAGSINKAHGYREIMIDYRSYRAHRLVWLLHTGEWPDMELDHINHVRDDNRYSNLRIATSTQNGANRSLASTNTSGFKGVSLNKRTGKWFATFRTGTTNKWLGTFASPEEAQKAYNAEAAYRHGEFANAASMQP